MTKGQIMALAACVGAPAAAQSARLPIAEGVWVKLDTPCASATNLFVHAGKRFGSVYFYGPNQSMGPANETEALVKTGRGTSGFTMVNEGPIEVAARPNGRAVVRAFSPVQGVAWSETVRLCPAASLPAKTRTALTRLRLLPAR